MTDQSSSVDGVLSVVEPPPTDDQGSNSWSDCQVGGVLLAAGTSNRFGDRNKLLATHDGEPLVRLAAKTLLEMSVDPIVVVVGYEADRVRKAIDSLPVDTVHNPAYASGQASSVGAGIEALQAYDGLDAALVALGDMPFVDPETGDRLVTAYCSGAGDALAAGYDGKRGNPVLFSRQYFGSLAGIEGDIGGREILLGSDDAALVAVDDPGVRRDVNVSDDL